MRIRSPMHGFLTNMSALFDGSPAPSVPRWRSLQTPEQRHTAIRAAQERRARRALRPQGCSGRLP